MIAQKPLVSVKGSVIICGLTCWFSVVLVYDVSSVEFCDIIFLIFLMHACQWYECLILGHYLLHFTSELMLQFINM